MLAAERNGRFQTPMHCGFLPLMHPDFPHRNDP